MNEKQRQIKLNARKMSLGQQEQYQLPAYPTLTPSFFNNHRNHNTNYPKARSHHAMIYFKNKILIWGGTHLESSDNNQTIVHSYDLQRQQWHRIFTKNNQKGLETLSAPAHALQNYKWYFFGGVKQNQQYSQLLWKLNLDTYQWTKCEQKGELPPPTEAGHMLFIEKNWMLYYQGFNSQNNMQGQLMYLHNIDTKTWYKCEGNYMHFLKFRIGTSICIQNDRIHLFGGAYQYADKMEYLNDLYSLKVWLPSKNNLANVEIRVIRTNIRPTSRYQHFLLPFHKNFLILLAGQNSQQNFLSNDVWIFNTKSQLWWNDSDFSCCWLQRYGSSHVIGNGSIYGFGGLDKGIRDESSQLKLMNDFWCFKVTDYNSKYYLQDSSDGLNNNSCSICYEKRNNFVFGKRAFSKKTVDSFIQALEFPFAAIGLLLDNALIHGATGAQISIQTNHQEQYIKIEDLGKNEFTTDQFINNIVSFGSQHGQMLLGCDKKIKKAISRQNTCRQFGLNLNMGCLRLGKSYLYVSLFGDSVRVCVCQQTKEEQTQEIYYYIYYYEQCISKTKLMSQDMKRSFLYIESQYKNHIKEIVKWKIAKNVVFIFNTILNQQDFRYIHERNDIYYGNKQDIERLQKMGYFVEESIDISLKAYLSMLYLKQDNFTITVTNKRQTNSIFLQGNLQKVDRMSRNGVTIELQGIIKFDFKLAEFYYLKELRKQYGFFSNGVVFYYKNRLVARYKPALGDMISYILGETNQHANVLPLYGYAEMPENITANSFKTDFTFAIMVEKMLSRIKFVDQYLKLKGKENECKRGTRFSKRKLKPQSKATPQKWQNKDSSKQKQKQQRQQIFQDESQKGGKND